MVYIPSSMRTRSIGEELIGLRKAAGYSGVQMARKLGWENSRLNRIELGKYNTSEVDFPTWRKSSYSASPDGDCVEVAFGQTVNLRDSKNPAGPMITVSPAAWRAFLGS